MNYRLKDLREDKDVTQQTLASKLKVSRSTYKGWENEIDNIPLYRLNDFCNYFEINLDYVVRLTNNKLHTKSKPINAKIIGNNLEIIRKELNITQKQFSKILSVSESSYVNYKHGKIIPQTLILKNFALKYNISMDWIVGKSDIKYFKR